MPRVIITVSDQTPQPYRFQLDRQLVKMGRGSDNDIVISCGSVSVNHAVMERIPGGYQLRDLDSTNGTKLDGNRLPTIALIDGRMVKLGDVSFDFSLTDEEKESLALEKPAAESKIIAENPEKKLLQAPHRGPVRRPSPAPATMASANPTHSFLTMLVFLVLAALAFYVGLSIRHEKETHQSLMQSMSNKGKPIEQAAPEAPSVDAATPATE
jgi:pSer/pThr/pTyr-binding forkhead associated (FHA) protein